MTKLITPEFRGSFVTVMQPKAFSPDQAAKYSIVVALPKDEKFFADLDAAIQAAAMEKWGEIPKKLKTFLKDGDEEDEKYDWAGKTVFTASNKSQPGIVVRTEQGLVEPMNDEDIYSGAFYRVSVRPYAYEYNKTKGVAISLDNVMKTKDGEKFTSRTKAKEDFADFLEGDWD
jgi:hypothetical protein